MKKRRMLRSLIWTIMRFSILQIVFMGVLSGALLAASDEAFSQTVLEEVVSLNAENKKIKNVLTEIEKSVDIKFTYNPQSIPLDQKISFNYQNQKLSVILDEIFSPLDIDFLLAGDYIILRKQQQQGLNGSVPGSNMTQLAFTVSGTVTDESGTGLPGVNVLVKGTTIGTTTDSEGKYTIALAEGTETLVFSFIGYAIQEIPVNNQSVINVVLQADVTSLNEVVVIGYGTAEKKQITSSVASVSAKDFNKGNVYNPAQFLQGKVAGLSIVRPGADPNAGYAIRLRGLSTFGANSQPLIVIDGVLGGSLQLIDPNDIESIDVLKDGSAAAIYGTQGSSGVIIVTTKKSKQGKGGIDYDSYVSMEQIAKSVDIATPGEFVELGGTDMGYKTDWLDLVTRKGYSQSHSLAFYGGAGQSNYRLSMNYRNVEGVARKSGFDQINTRLSLNHSALDGKLTLSSNMTVNLRKAQFIPYEAMRFALISNPTAPVYVDNDPSKGYLEPNSTEFHNPVAIVNETTDDGNFKTMLANIRAEYELFEGFKASVFYSLQYENDMRSQYYSSKMRFLGSSGFSGRATKFAEDRNSQLFELTGTFRRKFGDLDVNVVGGYAYQKFVFENFNAFNTGFITDDVLYNNLSLGTNLYSDNSNLRGFDSNKGEWLLASFFARTIIDYKSTYFFNAAYRLEGSSKFGANNRWGNFYSFGGGVDFSKLFSSPFDLLKLRAGYGVTGNLPDRNYGYKTLLNEVGYLTFNDGISENLIRLIGYTGNSNPDLKWEQKSELDVGLDFAAMDNRLTGSIDFYSRVSKDILLSQSVSQPPNLAPNTYLNFGQLTSKGIEAVVNYAVVTKGDWRVTTGVTYSSNKTRIDALNQLTSIRHGGNLGPPGLNNIVPIRAKVGEELGLIVAPMFVGLNEDGTRNILVTEDLDGNGVIETPNDWPVVGKGLPDFELAWNNSLTYKNFDLSFTLRGAFGHSLVNVNRAYYEVPDNINNYNLVVTKYFLPDMVGSEQWSSYYVEKADFVKLDNMALGYNFHVNNSVFRKLRLYVSGQNLFVITDYTGVDPEVHYTYGGDPLFPGVEDRNSYFRSKTYTVGLNVGF